jgi:hypothetical protein
MPKASPIQTNFSSGELTPYLDGRSDITRYFNGAKELENFIVLPTGGIMRRPGTYYVAEVKDSARKTRLVPFQFSTTQVYIVEFGDRYLRFYQNRGQITSSGSAYEITSPYLEADLFDLQFAQDADTMWITHHSYKPRKLTRGASTWDTYTKLMLHCNGTDASTTFTDEIGKTVTAAGNVQIDTAQYKFGGASGLFDGTGDFLSLVDHADWNFGTGDFTIDFQIRFDSVATEQRLMGQYEDADNRWRIIFYGTSISMIFTDGASVKGQYSCSCSMVADTWYHLVFERTTTTAKIFINGISQTLTETVAFGTNDVGDIAAVLKIGDDGTATNYFAGHIDEIRVSKGIARWSANFTAPTTAHAASVVVFTLKNYAPELLTLDVAPGSAWVAGDTVTGQTSVVTCEIVEVLTTKTYRVKDRSGTYTDGEVLTNGTGTADQGAGYPTLTGDPFGADASTDCPACVSIHEQRIFFANTDADPQKVLASVSGDYEDMTTGSNAADAFTYVIGSEQVNAIRWLSSGRALGMGTLGGIFSLSSGNDASPITPTNVVVKRETTYGSLGIAPKKIGNQVYYVQRDAKTIREFSYSYDIDEYIATNITLLADHITGDEIVDMDYQQSPYNILWCVRSDGEICSLTRQIDQEIVAWTRQVTDGDFESVAVIPGDGGDDEVWFVVERTINGSIKRYIEYLKPMDYGDEQEDAFFVDCGLTLDSPKPITAITKASPGVLTATGHGFSNDDIVIVRGVLGMTQVNNEKFKVANVTLDTFELTDPDTGADVSTTSYTTYVSGGEVRKCVTSVSGLSHLALETVDVLIDGVPGTSGVVSSGGVITITDPVNGGGEIHAGLNYISTLKTMRLEAGSAQGTAQSKLKRIHRAFAMIINSLKMKFGNEDNTDEVTFSDNTLFSGWKDITFPSVWDRNGYAIITQEEPLPLIILAIVLYMTTSDA